MPPGIDNSADPQWLRTGYRHFPYATEQSGAWWVLRRNRGFPEHDLYTVFVDGRAVADITGDAASTSPLLAGIAALTHAGPGTAPAQLAPAIARDVVRMVSRYVDYGSERGEPCDFCGGGQDGMARG